MPIEYSQWSCNNWSFGNLWPNRIPLITLVKFSDQGITPANLLWNDWQIDKWMNKKGKSLFLQRFYYKAAGDYMAWAECGGGWAGMWLCRWQAEFWSPAPQMAASLVCIQASSGTEPLISPSADFADYMCRRVTLIETSDYLDVQFVIHALFSFWNLSQVDVVSGMFMFCMPEALQLVVLRFVCNLLTLKPQPKTFALF